MVSRGRIGARRAAGTSRQGCGRTRRADALAEVRRRSRPPRGACALRAVAPRLPAGRGDCRPGAGPADEPERDGAGAGDESRKDGGAAGAQASRSLGGKSGRGVRGQMDARMSDELPTDLQRYPTLSDHGRKMLKFLREHFHAPNYRNQSGNRLTVDDVVRVRAFEEEVRTSSIDWTLARPPAWRAPFIDRCFEEIPWYRALGSPPSLFEDLPPISRADLSRDITRFVPDSVPLDRLINFRTSGTTGHPPLLASHPVVAASYLAFHKRALRRFGIELQHRRGQVGVVLLGLQRKCFTYVSVTPTMDDSGLAKINLHPDDWRHPDDRARYLDALSPEVYAGDPLSFAELLRLSLVSRPRALLSTSMALSPALRQELEARFGCPVLDLYSMNEAGPIAVFDPGLGGHALLQHCLFVEILDNSGRPVAPGVQGEVTLTGGFNF